MRNYESDFFSFFYINDLQAKEVRRLADNMVQLGKEVCIIR